jgi:prepilin-type N-terminal cleavage/methylation domain-containing protein
MSLRQPILTRRGARGFSLVEIMIALVVLAIGIMALGRLFPAGMHSQSTNRMATIAAQRANEEFETLRGLTRNNALLAAGRHPASGFDSLGSSRAWLRSYVVTSMAAPLDSLLKVDVTVRWRALRPDSIRMTDYFYP